MAYEPVTALVGKFAVQPNVRCFSVGTFRVEIVCGDLELHLVCQNESELRAVRNGLRDLLEQIESAVHSRDSDAGGAV
jgi:hypothetical protein